MRTIPKFMVGTTRPNKISKRKGKRRNVSANTRTKSRTRIERRKTLFESLMKDKKDASLTKIN